MVNVALVFFATDVKFVVVVKSKLNLGAAVVRCVVEAGFVLVMELDLV